LRVKLGFEVVANYRDFGHLCGVIVLCGYWLLSLSSLLLLYLAAVAVACLVGDWRLPTRCATVCCCCCLHSSIHNGGQDTWSAF
jgi:hypothetical protein